MISLITKIELLGYPQITPQDESKIRHWLTRFEIVGLGERLAEDAIIAATAIEK